MERFVVVADDALLWTLNAEQTLGRYELLTPIGRGGMSVVWAARLAGSRGFSKMVAIKVMLPHLSADPRFEKMFLTEAQIASRIRHPNVCEVLDLGDESGVLHLVMEWIDGEPLTAFLHDDTERLPIDLAALLVADAGRGLDAAHRLASEDGEPLGVVHRDVSPQNVLVTPSGAVKIVDFGVAKAAASGDQTTQSGFIKGKVAYVAPEQVNGPTVDARTDVFALGVVLYELTTGTHPFRGATDLATLLAVASTDEASPPTEIVADYPSELDAIVVRAIAKDPAERYASMAEMVADLDRFLEGTDARERAAELLTARLEPRRRARAEKLREAEAAFDAHKRTRARRGSTPDAAAAMPAPSKGSRRTLALAIAGALAIGVGIGAAGRFARSDDAEAKAPPAPVARPPATTTTEPVRETHAPDAAVAPSVALEAKAPPVVTAARARTMPEVVRVRVVHDSPPAVASGPPAPAPTPSGARFREPGF